MYEFKKRSVMIKKNFFLLSLILMFPGMVSAQESEDLEHNLSSPYNTLSTHINNLDEDHYDPKVAAEVFNQSNRTEEQAKELAIKLLQIYKGAGIIINFSQVPTEPNYTDSLSEKHRYYISDKYPEIYLEKKGNKWYYSEKAAERIPGLYKQVYPFGADKLLTLLPKLGTKKVFGLHIWQHIGLLLLILICVVIHQFFTLIIQRIILGLLIKKGKKTIAKKFVAPVAKPISILILFPILLVLVPVLQLPIIVNHYIMLVLKALWPVFATIVFYKLADIMGMYMVKLAEKTESTLDDQLVPLIRKTLKIFVVIIGGLAILANLDIDIIPLLTGLSIGGLAFALAAQDTLKNFFGSIMIFIDKPFQIGDWITSGVIDGTVEEVGFRATRIRTFRNSVMYVPNGTLASTTVDNHGLRQYRRFYTQIALTYDTPSTLINVFVEGLRKIVEKHPNTRKDYYNIYFNDMASHSLSVMFYIFFAVPTWPEELRCRHEILIEILKLAEELGVNFAFPTQTLHVESFPEKKPNSPEYLSASPALKKKLEAYLSKDKDWERSVN